MYQSVLVRLLSGAPSAKITHGWALMGLAAALLLHPTTSYGGELALGRAAGQPGQSVTVPLIYRQGLGPQAAGLATDIQFNPTALVHPRCAAGPALDDAAKSVVCAEPQPGLLRVGVYGLNLDPVPDGEVATITFDLLSQARRGLYSLRHTPSAADAQGRDFFLARRNGAVRVNGR
jgi:hypothetical protein